MYMGNEGTGDVADKDHWDYSREQDFGILVGGQGRSN
jgi:hypothetical protein